MKYYIGIDGGGTKSHAVLIDENKTILYEGYSSSTNFLTLGTEPVSETIFRLIKECKEKAQIQYNQIDGIFIGTTGAGRRTDAQSLEREFIKCAQKQNQVFKHVFVDSDAIVALEGAFDGAPGSILISGTGSIMYGKDLKDVVHRVGGFGRFIGDEGSGYSIGKRGLTAVAHAFDGRGKATLLTKLLENNFNITTPEDLITQIYKHSFDIAGFAPTVFRAAEQGDAAALDIVHNAINEIIEHIHAMKRKILVNILDVAFIGSVLKKDNILSRDLRIKIESDVTGVKIKEAIHPPAFGAALLAIKRSQTT